MDETWVPLDPKAPYIVASHGQKHPSYISGGSKSQITVLSCCNAAGYTIPPPFVIFDRKASKPELALGEVAGTMYGLSSSGWTVNFFIFGLSITSEAVRRQSIRTSCTASATNHGWPQLSL